VTGARKHNAIWQNAFSKKLWMNTLELTTLQSPHMCPTGSVFSNCMKNGNKHISFGTMTKVVEDMFVRTAKRFSVGPQVFGSLMLII